MKEWVSVIAVAELEKHWVTRVKLGQRLLAVYDTPTGIFVSLALCTHGGADLCDGYFDQHIIECPLHQGAFDVRTGRAISAPAIRHIKVFKTRIENDMVQVLV